MVYSLSTTSISIPPPPFYPQPHPLSSLLYFWPLDRVHFRKKVIKKTKHKRKPRLLGKFPQIDSAESERRKKITGRWLPTYQFSPHSNFCFLFFPFPSIFLRHQLFHLDASNAKFFEIQILCYIVSFIPLNFFSKLFTKKKWLKKPTNSVDLPTQPHPLSSLVSIYQRSVHQSRTRK